MTYTNVLGQKLGQTTKMPCANCGTLMIVEKPPVMFKCPKCPECDCKECKDLRK